MLDGSDAIADWPILSVLPNAVGSATWVSFHHGGGVGIGCSLHAGQVIVADETPRELPTMNCQPTTRILVVRPGALGDVLLTLPVLEALQARYPQAAIEVMGNLAVLRLLVGRSVVSAVSSFDRADLGALFRHEAIPSAALHRYLDQFDIIVSYAAPLSHVFAHNLARLTRGRVVSFDAQPGADVGVHMSDYLQRPLQELYVTERRQPVRLTLTVEDRQDAEQWWEEQGLVARQVLAVHPSSGSPAKNWPASRFAAVSRDLQRRCGMHTLLVSGPADEIAVGEVRGALGGCEHTLVQGASLQQLAALIAHCQTYLGNDSGVSHLAAAVGVPTVVVFGPTDPGVWAPRGSSVYVVQGAVPCAPCDAEQRRACCQRDCLESVTETVVVEALLAVLDSRQA